MADRVHLAKEPIPNGVRESQPQSVVLGRLPARREPDHTADNPVVGCDTPAGIGSTLALTYVKRSQRVINEGLHKDGRGYKLQMLRTRCPYRGEVGKGKGGYGHRLLTFISHVTVLATPYRRGSAQNVSKYVAQAHMSLLALRYPSDIAVLIRARSHRCFGREGMHQMLTPDDENATLAWLEDALGQAYAHGQMTTLAYLKAVMEDVVFVMEMTVRKASLVA